MKARQYLTGSLVLISLFLPSCAKETPTDPPVQRPYIIGEVEREIWYDEWYEEWYIDDYTWVWVLGTDIIPSVTVNAETLSVEAFPFYYSTDMRLIPGDPYNLTVDFSGDIARAGIHLPDTFTLIHPHHGYHLPQDSALTIIWTPSKYAGWYLVELDIWCGYIDTLGNFNDWDDWREIPVDDTTHTVPWNELVPPDVDSILWWDGEIKITAMDGPRIEPGSSGNITGAGIGFFWGAYGLDWIALYMVGTKEKEIERARENRIERRIELLRRYDPRLDEILNRQEISLGL